MDIIAPGIHWDAVQLLCHLTLLRGFQRLGIFKTPDSPGSGLWNSEEGILTSGITSAFYPHGAGHTLGLDVVDVSSASKPAVNDTLDKVPVGHADFYKNLQFRLPLEEGIVIVSTTLFVPRFHVLRCSRLMFVLDLGAWHLFLSTSSSACA